MTMDETAALVQSQPTATSRLMRLMKEHAQVAQVSRQRPSPWSGTLVIDLD
jgi:hypothetical protein